MDAIKIELTSNSEKLHATVQEVAGHRYDSQLVADIIDSEDWTGFWPVCDADGLLTGEITDCDDENEWATVDDLAVVNILLLPDEKIAEIRDLQERCLWDGTICLQ